MNTPPFSPVHRFRDRREAGQLLAQRLGFLAGSDSVILGLARGGVPIGREVALALRLPLDVFVVRKLGVPDHEELAMGAIASGNVRVLNEDVIARVRDPEITVENRTVEETRELLRHEELYRRGREPVEIKGSAAVLVDDGLATGSTMRAAIQAVRHLGATRCIVAAPVAPPDTAALLRREADEVICVEEPEPFTSVSAYYETFPQVSDEEVTTTLASLPIVTSRL